MARTLATARRGGRRFPGFRRRTTAGPIRRRNRHQTNLDINGEIISFDPSKRTGEFAQFFNRSSSVSYLEESQAFVSLKNMSLPTVEKGANYCTSLAEKAMVCYTCSDDEEYVLCLACFNPQQHKDHSYLSSGDYSHLLCACGRLQNISCPLHNESPQFHDIALKRNAYRNILDLLIFVYDLTVKNNEEAKNVYSKILLLIKQNFTDYCKDNISYIQIVHEILSEVLPVEEVEDHKNVTRLQLILGRKLQSMELKDLFLSLAGSSEFLFDWVRCCMKSKYLIDDEVMTHFPTEVMQMLGEQKIFLQNLQVQYLKLNPNKSDLTLKFLEYRKEKMQGELLLKFIEYLVIEFPHKKITDQKLHEFFIKQAFEYFKNPKAKIPKKLKEQNAESESEEGDADGNEKAGEENQQENEEQDNEQNEEDGESKSSSGSSSQSSSEEEQEQKSESEEDLQQNSQENKDQIEKNKVNKGKKLQFRKSAFLKARRKVNGYNSSIVKALNDSLFRLIKGDEKRISQIPFILEYLGIEEKDFEEYKILCFNEGLVNEPSMEKNILIIYWLMEEKNPETVNIFWSQTLKGWKNMGFLPELQTISSIFSFSATFPHQLNVFRKKMAKDEASIAEIEEKQREDLKKFLFYSRRIRKHDLWNLKCNGRFDFPDAGHIVESHCLYNQQEEQFTYISPNEYPSYTHKLEVSLSEDNIAGQFLKLTSQKPQFESEMFERMCTFLVSGTELTQILIKSFNAFLKEIQKDEGAIEDCKQERTVLKYLQLLIFIHNVSRVPHQAIDQELSKIKKQPDHRFKYSYLSTEQNINEMMGLQQAEQKEKQERKEQIEEEDKQHKQNLKKKMLQKKKAKAEQMKKKQTNILELMKSKSVAINEEEDDICLTCHEKEKSDNQLIYLGVISKDNTLSSCIFGSDNKGGVSLQTCFHTVHIQCFKKMDKRNSEFSCPLCSKRRNCILPVKFSSLKNKTYRICSNYLIASLFNSCQIYDLEDIFMLFFKHLVESYGLGSLVNMNRASKRQNKEKINHFIQNFLEEMYGKGNLMQKEEYQTEIDEFISEIEKCERKQVKQVQLIIARSLKTKILAKEVNIDYQKLAEIHQILKNEEFLVVRDQIEQIVQQPVRYEAKNNQHSQDEKKKGLAFNPVSLPQNVNQLSNFGTKICERCPQSSSSICLICGISLCDNCEGSQKHKTEHKKRVLNFIKNEGELCLQNLNQCHSEYVYENEFRVAWNEARSGAERAKTVFKLKGDKVEELLSKFYDEDF